MKFELNDDQIKILKEWQTKIKKKHKEYGMYDFTFTPTGIGCVVKVYSRTAKKELDLTEIEKW